MSKNKFIHVLVALYALCGFALTAQAAPAAGKKDAVQINLELFKVVVKNGKETLVDGKQAKPGELLEYRTTYKNVTKQPVRNLAATLPVPDGMEYVDKSASPGGVEASLDRKTYALVPLMRPDGKEPVPAREYRALRWHVPELGAERNFVVSARMRVSQQ